MDIIEPKIHPPYTLIWTDLFLHPTSSSMIRTVNTHDTFETYHEVSEAILARFSGRSSR